jgi:hypothetical protein
MALIHNLKHHCRAECKLLDGTILYYSRCGKNITDYDNMKSRLTYLGQGIIHSIDGKVQNFNPEDLYHFWKEKEQKC